MHSSPPCRCAPCHLPLYGTPRTLPAVYAVVLVMPRVPSGAKSGPVIGHMAHIPGAVHENGSMGCPCGLNKTHAAPMVKEGCGYGIRVRFSENQGESRYRGARSVGVCARSQ